MSSLETSVALSPGDGTSPLLKGVPVIPEGHVIEGEFFPLVR